MAATAQDVMRGHQELSEGSITATRRPAVAAADAGLAGPVPNEGDMMYASATDLFSRH